MVLSSSSPPSSSSLLSSDHLFRRWVRPVPNSNDYDENVDNDDLYDVVDVDETNSHDGGSSSGDAATNDDDDGNGDNHIDEDDDDDDENDTYLHRQHTNHEHRSLLLRSPKASLKKKKRSSMNRKRTTNKETKIKKRRTWMIWNQCYHHSCHHQQCRQLLVSGYGYCCSHGHLRPRPWSSIQTTLTAPCLHIMSRCSNSSSSNNNNATTTTSSTASEFLSSWLSSSVVSTSVLIRQYCPVSISTALLLHVPFLRRQQHHHDHRRSTHGHDDDDYCNNENDNNDDIELQRRRRQQQLDHDDYGEDHHNDDPNQPSLNQPLLAAETMKRSSKTTTTTSNKKETAVSGSTGTTTTSTTTTRAAIVQAKGRDFSRTQEGETAHTRTTTTAATTPTATKRDVAVDDDRQDNITPIRDGIATTTTKTTQSVHTTTTTSGSTALDKDDHDDDDDNDVKEGQEQEIVPVSHVHHDDSLSPPQTSSESSPVPVPPAVPVTDYTVCKLDLENIIRQCSTGGGGIQNFDNIVFQTQSAIDNEEDEDDDSIDLLLQRQRQKDQKKQRTTTTTRINNGDDDSQQPPPPSQQLRFYIRIPLHLDAATQELARRERLERAERTADFMETAKALSIRLSTKDAGWSTNSGSGGGGKGRHHHHHRRGSSSGGAGSTRMLTRSRSSSSSDYASAMITSSASYDHNTQPRQLRRASNDVASNPGVEPTQASIAGGINQHRRPLRRSSMGGAIGYDEYDSSNNRKINRSQDLRSRSPTTRRRSSNSFAVPSFVRPTLSRDNSSESLHRLLNEEMIRTGKAPPYLSSSLSTSSPVRDSRKESITTSIGSISSIHQQHHHHHQYNGRDSMSRESLGYIDMDVPIRRDSNHGDNSVDRGVIHTTRGSYRRSSMSSIYTSSTSSHIGYDETTAAIPEQMQQQKQQQAIRVNRCRSQRRGSLVAGSKIERYDDSGGKRKKTGRRSSLVS